LSSDQTGRGKNICLAAQRDDSADIMKKVIRSMWERVAMKGEWKVETCRPRNEGGRTFYTGDRSKKGKKKKKKKKKKSVKG